MAAAGWCFIPPVSIHVYHTYQIYFPILCASPCSIGTISHLNFPAPIVFLYVAIGSLSEDETRKINTVYPANTAGGYLHRLRAACDSTTYMKLTSSFRWEGWVCWGELLRIMVLEILVAICCFADIGRRLYICTTEGFVAKV